MENKSKIIDRLKKDRKKLIPVPGLKIQFKKSRSLSKAFDSDFQALVIYKDLRFRIIGEAISHNISAIFKDKLSRLKAYPAKKDFVPIIIAPYLSP
ncbi:MAG: hypothetical protein KAS40_10625, partial [Desulfobacterales bacterium]|nr:hypothetical protein [Desulfobacterales bacterium]